MWGLMVKLCGGNAAVVSVGVDAGKKGVISTTYLQAQEMTMYGYSGVDLGLSSLGCKVSTDPYQGPRQPMSWVWEPLRSRTD